MSSLGRFDTNIDINTASLLAISEIKELVEVNKSKIDINTVNITSNYESITTINTTIGSKKTEDDPATGIFLDIETNEESITTINTKIGDNESDPKTGIFFILSLI